MKRLALLALVLGIAGCSKEASHRVQGYVEGEYVLVASPLAGQLEELSASRGQKVEKGDPLFALEHGAETAALNEAERRLTQAEANLADARAGQRPTEIDALEAQLQRASAALILSEKEFARQDRLVRTGASAQQELDRARAARDQDRQRAEELRADLKTARLGSRSGQIAAAEASVLAQQAAVAGAKWNLDQKQQSAPKSGLVFDTMYREGEWVGAGMPTVSLLPPENILVRAFVPETWVGSVRPGEEVEVFVDGLDAPISGRVTYIAPRAEFTPPVIYSNEAREKLVYLVRIVPADAARLSPGQPVDVQFP